MLLTLDSRPLTLAPFPILYEDNHVLAVAKPAMLPTMGVPDGKQSALMLAKDYVKRKYEKPGNVYLGTVSRLDAPVTGVLLFARTSKAAGRLSRQFREREVERCIGRLYPGESNRPRGLWLIGSAGTNGIEKCIL